MRFGPDELDAEEEQRELKEVLQSGPGTRDVAMLGPHPKGDHRVQFALFHTRP